tara:strand:- start:508 stop:687 length:180 start_codon:yes stop_codon:yes gene_type:complete
MSGVGSKSPVDFEEVGNLKLEIQFLTDGLCEQFNEGWGIRKCSDRNLSNEPRSHPGQYA